MCIGNTFPKGISEAPLCVLGMYGVLLSRNSDRPLRPEQGRMVQLVCPETQNWRRPSQEPDTHGNPHLPATGGARGVAQCGADLWLESHVSLLPRDCGVVFKELALWVSVVFLGLPQCWLLIFPQVLRQSHYLTEFLRNSCLIEPAEACSVALTCAMQNVGRNPHVLESQQG